MSFEISQVGGHVFETRATAHSARLQRELFTSCANLIERNQTKLLVQGTKDIPLDHLDSTVMAFVYCKDHVKRYLNHNCAQLML